MEMLVPLFIFLSILNSGMTLEEFALPEFSGKQYSNPKSFKNWKGVPSVWDIVKWKTTETDRSQVPEEKILNETIPIHPMTSFESHSDLFASWLGHATVLVGMEGAKFITDPIWANRASPLGFSGPRRYRPPPMKIDDVPQLDFGVISHDHYDHLDVESVKTLSSRFPNMRWFVPKGMKSWMESIEIKNTEETPDRVTEMNWGESTVLSIRGVNFTIWCVPAQHWCQRGILDRNVRLWSGWVIEGQKKKFYYTGDTGMCDEEFKKIGEKFGPIDLAAIPIGCYEPHWVMTSQHIGPTEAVEIHKLIKSKFSIGIHWGTYTMGSYEPYLAPKQLLEELVAKDPKIDNKFVTIEQGTIWEDNN